MRVICCRNNNEARAAQAVVQKLAVSIQKRPQNRYAKGEITDGCQAHAQQSLFGSESVTGYGLQPYAPGFHW